LLLWKSLFKAVLYPNQQGGFMDFTFHDSAMLSQLAKSGEHGKLRELLIQGYSGRPLRVYRNRDSPGVNCLVDSRGQLLCKPRGTGSLSFPIQLDGITHRIKVGYDPFTLGRSPFQIRLRDELEVPENIIGHMVRLGSSLELPRLVEALIKNPDDSFSVILATEPEPVRFGWLGKSDVGLIVSGAAPSANIQQVVRA
jgi:hypothetical protein